MKTQRAVQLPQFLQTPPHKDTWRTGAWLPLSLCTCPCCSALPSNWTTQNETDWKTETVIFWARFLPWTGLPYSHMHFGPGVKIIQLLFSVFEEYIRLQPGETLGNPTVSHRLGSCTLISAKQRSGSEWVMQKHLVRFLHWTFKRKEVKHQAQRAAWLLQTQNQDKPNPVQLHNIKEWFCALLPYAKGTAMFWPAVIYV